jgi:hypothetical protein
VQVAKHTLSQILRAMGYRKLSACPRDHSQGFTEAETSH